MTWDLASDGAPVVIERSGVDECFGCSQTNPSGLRLKFFVLDDGSVRIRHTPDEHHSGAADVVHGGIQATLLDEVMGVAAQLSLPADASSAPCVTAEMQLRYRRPVPMTEVTAMARIVRVDGPDHFVEGAIVAPNGEELTIASSRWRQLSQVR